MQTFSNKVGISIKKTSLSEQTLIPRSNLHPCRFRIEVQHWLMETLSLKILRCQKGSSQLTVEQSRAALSFSKIKVPQFSRLTYPTSQKWWYLERTGGMATISRRLISPTTSSRRFLRRLGSSNSFNIWTWTQISSGPYLRPFSPSRLWSFSTSLSTRSRSSLKLWVKQGVSASWKPQGIRSKLFHNQ